MSTAPKPTPNQAPHVVQSSEHSEEDAWFNDRLFTTRTILLNGRVDDALARRVNQSLLILAADNVETPINVIVNSGGGSVSAGFAIFDMLRYIKPRVRMISAGMTGSIATIIFSAAPRADRLSLPNSRFLIHQPLIPFNVFGATSDLEITANEMLKTRKRINEVLAEACGQSLERVAKDTQRDFWMGAEEAVEYGLVGRVISTRADL